MRRSWLLTSAVILALLVSACAPAATPSPTATAPPEVKVIRIALEGPLTGDTAYWGNQMVQGALLAMKHLNEAGGPKSGPFQGAKYEAVGPFDDRADPKEAANIAQNLLTMDDVLAMVGPVNSSCAFAIGPILDEGRFPFVSGGASNPDLTKQGWTVFFRAFLHDGARATYTANYMVEQRGFKKLVVWYANNDYGLGMFKYFEPRVKELGADLLSTDTYMSGVDKDFSALITKWQALNPEAFVSLGEYTEPALIVRQMRAAGLDQPVYAEGAYSPEFIEIAGEAAEGVIVDSWFDPTSPDPVIQKFVGEFREEYGEDAAENASAAYDAMLVLNDAIERMEGPTREDLLKALGETDNFQAMNVVVTFDETGEIVVPGKIPMLVVEDGRFVTFTGE